MELQDWQKNMIKKRKPIGFMYKRMSGANAWRKLLSNYEKIIMSKSFVGRPLNQNQCMDILGRDLEKFNEEMGKSFDSLSREKQLALYLDNYRDKLKERAKKFLSNNQQTAGTEK